MSDSLWPHGLHHPRLPCPSPTPRACSNSCPSSQWCHPIISSSVIPVSSCLQSCPASRSFPISQFFSSGVSSTEVAHLLQLTKLHWHIIFTQRPQFTVRFTVGIVYSVDLDKYKMIWIYHNSITQSIFTARKPLYDSLTYSLIKALATTDIFTLYVVLPFANWHTVGTTHYIAFSHQLLSLGNTHIFSKLDGLFFHFSFNFYFILRYSWFTILCSFLLYRKVIQLFI